MQNKILRSTLACLLVGTALSARAQLVNDEPAGAIPVPLDSARSPLLTTTAGATASAAPAPQPCGTTAAGKDTWYSVQVPASGAVTVTTAAVAGSPLTDTVLEVFAGSIGSLIPLGCNDDYTAGHHFSSMTVVGQPAGSTLYVRVYGFGNVGGAFSLHAATAALLANDEISGAIPLPADGQYSVVAATNAGASATAGVPAPQAACLQSTAPISNDVWFSLVVPVSGQVAVRTSPVVGSELSDTALMLYSGTPEKLTQLACNDDLGPNNFYSGALASGLTPGSTVYVRVWSAQYSLTGAFNVCVLPPATMPAPMNVAKLPLLVSANPVHESLSVKLPTLADQRSAQLSLRNSAGQVVKLRLVSLKAREGETSLDVSDLPAGIYSLRLQTGLSIGTHKVVIE